MKKPILLILASVVLLLVSLWFLMWIFSSASLASGYCKNDFSLFHEEFRCRQPYIALIGFLVSSLSSIAMFIAGILGWRKKSKQN